MRTNIVDFREKN